MQRPSGALLPWFRRLSIALNEIKFYLGIEVWTVKLRRVFGGVSTAAITDGALLVYGRASLRCGLCRQNKPTRYKADMQTA